MEDGPARPSRTRRVGARVLLVLGCLALMLANVTVWLRLTALDTDRFVGALAPLAQDEELGDALSVELTDRVFDEVDVESRVAEAVGDDNRLIVATVTRLARGLVSDAVRDVLRSDAFAGVWEDALRRAHRQALAVVEGDSADIALRFTDVLDRADRALQDLGFDVVDRRTIERIDDVVVARADQVKTAGRVVELLRTLSWALPLATLVLLGLALLAAPDRRHVVGLIGVGAAVAMVVTFVALRIGRRLLFDRIDGDIARRAAGDVWTNALTPLFRQTAVLLALGLLAAAGAWLLGPAAVPVRVRGRVAAGRRGERRAPSPLVGRLAPYRRQVQAAVLVVAAAALLLLPSLTVGTAVVILVLAAVLVVALDRLVPAPPPTPA